MHEIQDNAANSQMQNTSISPRDPEEFTQYVQEVYRQIMPAIDFHDQLMKDISKAIDSIPVLPQIIEQLEEQLSRWTFSIMAPFVVPIVQQVKNELRTGSSEIIESSKNEQHVVFDDDRCTDPTHSMLSKDHFSNVSISMFDVLMRFLTVIRSSTNPPARQLPRLSPGSSHSSWKLGTMKVSMSGA